MTRQRTVREDATVAHLWAHQSQGAAHNLRGNLFFRGETIYSYGYHFPIARFIEHRKKKCVLITTRSYSATTTGHISTVCGALRNCAFPVFHVSEPNVSNRTEQFRDYSERYEHLCAEYIKAKGRKPEIHAELRALSEEANAFAAFFGLRQRLSIPGSGPEIRAELEKIRRRERNRAARKAREYARQQAEAAVRAADALREWMAGGELRFGYNLPGKLRIVGEHIETSLGAVFPLKHAVLAYKALAKMRAAGKTYQSNGHAIRLGAFAIDSMDENGTVIAGCHAIEWAEVERIAGQARAAGLLQ